MDPQTNPIIPGNTPTPSTLPNQEIPRTEPETVSLPPSEPKSSGPIIGIIVVILLLVGGAFYVWQTKLSNQTPPPLPETDQATAALETVGTSTEPNDIEADLINTDLEGLDLDLGALLIETTQ
jgi:hypothetical protein